MAEQKNNIDRSKIEAGGNVHVGDNRNPPSTIPLLILAIFAIIVLAYFFKQVLDKDGNIPEKTEKISTDTLPAAKVMDTSTSLKGENSPKTEVKQTPPSPVVKQKASPEKYKIAGKLSDKIDGMPLTGAIVSINGIKGNSTTDVNGYFEFFLLKIPAKREYTIYFRKEGYEAQEETYYEIPNINIIKYLSPTK